METAEEHLGIAVKVHETPKGRVVGACDRELVGRRLSEGELLLEISERFYSQMAAGPAELLEIIEGCMTANLVGERTVAAYCAENPDAIEAVKRIGGVPHLLVFHL